MADETQKLGVEVGVKVDGDREIRDLSANIKRWKEDLGRSVNRAQVGSRDLADKLSKAGRSVRGISDEMHRQARAAKDRNEAGKELLGVLGRIKTAEAGSHAWLTKSGKVRRNQIGNVREYLKLVEYGLALQREENRGLEDKKRLRQRIADAEQRLETRRQELVTKGIRAASAEEARASEKRSRSQRQAESTARRLGNEELRDIRRRISFATNMSAQKEGEDRRNERARLKAVNSLFRTETGLAKQRAKTERDEEAARIKGIRGVSEFGQRMDRQRAAEQRKMEREAEGHARRASQGFYTGGQHARQGFSTASSMGAVTTAATAALTGGAVRAIVREALSLDTATALASNHIFNEEGQRGRSASLGDEWRRGWAIPSGIALGRSPAELMRSAGEFAQAGVPQGSIQTVTELASKIAQSMAIPIDAVESPIGRAIAQSPSLRNDPDKIREFMNITAGYAAHTAANRQEIFAFARKGIGSGRLAGLNDAQSMALGAGLIEGGAEGSQAARAVGEIFRDISGLEGREQDAKRRRRTNPRTLTAADRTLLAAPKQLGYASFADASRRIKADPLHLFEFIKRFNRIQDRQKMFSTLKSVFGDEFFAPIANLVENPDIIDRNLGLTDKFTGQNPKVAVIEDGWKLWTGSFQFIVNQMRTVGQALKAELGDELKDLADDIREYVVAFQAEIPAAKTAMYGFKMGLIEGLLGREGTFRDLLRGAFGKPGEFGKLDPKTMFDFARGFGRGLKTAWEELKRVFTAIGKVMGVDTSNAEGIGELAGKLLGLSIALVALRPVVGVVSVISSMAFAVAGFVASLVALKKLLGVTGLGKAAFGAGFLGGSGGLAGLAAKLGPAIALAFAKAPIAVTLAAIAGAIVLGVKIIEWTGFDQWLKRYTDSGTPEEKRSPIEKPRQSLQWWEVDPLFHRQSFEGFDAPGVQIHRASLEVLEDIRDRIRPANDNFGGMYHRASLTGGRGYGSARFQLAALHNPASPNFGGAGSGGGSSGGSGGGGGGGGSGGGGSSGGGNGDNTPIPEGPATGAAKTMLDAISRAEGTVKRGYNEVLGSGRYGLPSKPLTQMTLAEAFRFGRTIKARHGSSSAIGRYQIVGNTMKEAAKGLGLDWNTARFDEATQDRMAQWIARRQGLGAWEGFKHHPRQRAIAAEAMRSGAASQRIDPSNMPAGSGGTANGAPVAGDMSGDQVHRMARSARVMSQQCISLARAVVGSTSSVTTWRRGEAAAAGTLRPGTPIATFMDRNRRLSERYAGGGLGSAGTKRDHAAVFESYIRDAAGKIVGMNVSEQWKGSRGVRRERYMFGDGGHTTHNGSSYYAIRDPSGRYLGGANNPMNRARGGAPGATPGAAASGVPRQTPADAARGAPTPTPANNNASAGQMVRNNGGNSGGVTINVNGYNKNPQELAEDVQRRISQARNWRTHDVEHSAA